MDNKHPWKGPDGIFPYWCAVGRLESAPFDAGDECVCGGTFIEFDPLAKKEDKP